LQTRHTVDSGDLVVILISLSTGEVRLLYYNKNCHTLQTKLRATSAFHKIVRRHFFSGELVSLQFSEWILP